jgi:hypothetical protein
MVSFYHYSLNRTKNFNGTFQEFIRHKDFGLISWFDHFKSWNNKYGILVSYENLLHNSVEELQKIVSFIGLPGLTNNQVEDIILRNSISKLRDKNPKAIAKNIYRISRKTTLEIEVFIHNAYNTYNKNFSLINFNNNLNKILNEL